MSEIERYIAPTQLTEAVQALSYGAVTILAGGTDLTPQITDGKRTHAPTLMNIRRLEELSRISLNEGEIRIGALVTVSEIRQNKLLQERAGILGEAASHFASEQIVLKPRISANADNTFWLTKQNAMQTLSEMNVAFDERDFMIQPFMAHILSEGEYSLFYFNGEYSHAILKTPKENDFRVQEEHGGRLTTIEPEMTLVEHANQCMKAISQLHQMPLYARVDFVRHQQGFALMEAELIEPSLYFNMDENSPLRFAQAFAKRMNRLAL